MKKRKSSRLSLGVCYYSPLKQNLLYLKYECIDNYMWSQDYLFTPNGIIDDRNRSRTLEDVVQYLNQHIDTYQYPFDHKKTYYLSIDSTPHNLDANFKSEEEFWMLIVDTWPGQIKFDFKRPLSWYGKR